MSKSKQSLQIIDYLVSCGRKADSFEKSFPFIHHFHEKSGDDSLNGFIKHCQNNELTVRTNLNVHLRLEHIKNQVEQFLAKNTDANGISSIKYQSFAKNSLKDIPL